jgi:hypothetical protein
MEVTVVTGFIPINGHPRATSEYEALGKRLDDAVSGHAGMCSFHGETVEETWLWRFLLANAPGATHSVADNPRKNTMAYHCVQHQKFEWLRRAEKLVPEADVYVWIDYGIMGAIPGVTAKVIQEFLARVAAADFGVIRIPGCWDRPVSPSKDNPCWRFCGGVMVVPKSLVHLFATSCAGAAMEYIKLANNVEWEVNTMARAETIAQLPIAWYAADHNQTMFTGFP